MTLQQGVVMASWDADKREFVAKFGRESIEGLGAITYKLGENRWEIISVVPIESTNAPTGVVSKTNNRSRTAVDALAIFVKRYQTAQGDSSSGDPSGHDA
jgi:hypothetical protein